MQGGKQVHGFYLVKEEKCIRFDIVVSLGADNRRNIYTEILNDVSREFPDYQFQIVLDTDFSEE